MASRKAEDDLVSCGGRTDETPFNHIVNVTGCRPLNAAAGTRSELYGTVACGNARATNVGQLIVSERSSVSGSNACRGDHREANGRAIAAGSPACRCSGRYELNALVRRPGCLVPTQRMSTRLSPLPSLFLFIVLLFARGTSDVAKADVVGDGGQTQVSLPQQPTSNGRIVRLSPCRAIVDGRLINLEPLQSTDGSPRFVSEFDGNWKMSFNPCVSYNLPTDPHSGSGDQCHYVAACKYREMNSTQTEAAPGEYFTVGLQRTADFQLSSQSALDSAVNRSAHVTGVELAPTSASRMVEVGTQAGNGNSTSRKLDGNVLPSGGDQTQRDSKQDAIKTASPWKHEIKLILRGIRSMKRRKVFINLICDFSRSQPLDALFTAAAVSPPNSSHYYFELRHRCCCPDGCPHNVYTSAILHRSEHRVTAVESAEIDSDSASRWTGPLRILSHQSRDSVTSMPAPTDSSDGGLPRSPGPRFLWIVLVVNGSIIITAVLVAALCCRRGGGLMSTGPYTYIPALHASRGTVNSVDPKGAMSAFMTGVKSAGGIGLSVGLGTGMAERGSGIIGGNSTGPGPSSVDYRDYSTAAAPSSRLPQLDNCVISSHAIEIGQRLGGGLFGDTYLCEWKSRNVAAKRITVGVHQGQMGAADLEWIADCVTLLSKQRHSNLVAVIGVVLDTKNLYIINEYVEGESLRDLLRRSSTSETAYSWPFKIKVCIQVADGMAFLHSAKRPILHRDLRCANVLVDKTGKAKIVDFGLTRIVQRLRNECDRGSACYCQKDLSALPASIRWTAPEVLANPRASEDGSQPNSSSASFQTGVLGPACDVYSFSMLLWELSTSSDPFEDITDERQVVQLILDGTRPSLDVLPRGTIPHIKELLKHCWDQNPEVRPPFKQVALCLKTISQIVGKLASQPFRERSDSMRSTTTSIYLRSTLNVGLDP